MEYKPKVITGKVTGTGWPIDGHVLWFSQWDYDNRESWHLYGWEDSEDEAVMQTVFQTETEAGLCLFDTLEKFAENWKAKKWEPQGSFCLPLDKVEVLEVKQEESTNNSMIMALPGRLAMDVVQVASANEASALIRAECYKILNELANYNYDPAVYQRRVRDREGWSDVIVAADEADD